MKNNNSKSPFWGELTIQEAAIGIQYATENAHDLLSDAELLFKNSRYERSFALSVLAIEEASKPGIIRCLLVVDRDNVKREWKKYRKHTHKNLTHILPDLVINGARKLNDFLPMYSSTEHGEDLEFLKQHSLYSDILQNRKWLKPNTIITEGLAKTLLTTASFIVNGNDYSLNIKQELEIWVKYMKPAWDKGYELMADELLKCYIECEKLGAVKEGFSEKMSQFITKGL